MISHDTKQLTQLADAHIKARIVLIPMGLSPN
jgi:hypothetical protein